MAAGGDADLVEQAFRALELVSIPPGTVAAGDATRWCVVRDHDGPAYHVRSLDTGARASVELGSLALGPSDDERTLPLTPAGEATPTLPPDP